jgi:hypothetical protein
MMRRIKPILAFLAFLAFLAAPVAVSGCGSSNTIWVTGKLLKGGAAYTAPEGQKLGVVLYAMEVKDETGNPIPAGEPYAAVLNPTAATFTVPGPDGRGIHPGTYRISVVQTMIRDALANAPKPKRGQVGIGRETDMLKNQFGPATSPIIQELKSSGEISVDLGRADAMTEAPNAEKKSKRASRN